MIALVLALAGAGEIHGTLTAVSGEPIEGGLVLAYDRRLEYELDYADEAGRFTVDELKEGSYRLRVISPDEVNAVESFFPDALGLCDALPVELGEDEILELGVLAIPEGGVVTGRVLGPEGTPIEGLELSTRPAEVSASALPRSAFTDVDGRFEIRGIPVLADGPLWTVQVEGQGLPDQYLGEDAFTADDGEVFGVGIGDITDVGEWTLRPGGTIAGQVLGPNGPVLVGTVYGVTTGLEVSTELVGGVFELTGLAPGEAQVWVEAPGLGAAWYPDATAPGVTIPVEDGERVDGIGIRAVAEAILRGRLTGAPDFTGTTMTLFNRVHTVAVTLDVDSDGRFEAVGMPAGAWTVELDPAEGLDAVNGPFLDDQGNVLELELTAGKVLDLGPTAVPRGAVMEGTVTDRSTGEGVYGARVSIENVNTSSSVVVLSGRAGKFRAEGLPAGVYRMSAEYSPFCDEDPDWAARHFPDQRNSVLTGSIPLAPGQVGRWEPRLPQDMDHDAMGDPWEGRFGLKVGVDDGLEDLDGDGFANLDEYLLGTNPAGAYSASCGCSENGASWLLFWMPTWWLRRRRARAANRPV